MALTPRQRRFVEAYAGNAAEAARAAGYSEKCADVQGCRLLRNAQVAEAIKAREAKATKSLIMSREERQAFWTAVARGEEPDADMNHRLKAAELLGKSNADFVDRHEVKLEVSLEALVLESFGGKR